MYILDKHIGMTNVKFDSCLGGQFPPPPSSFLFSQKPNIHDYTRKNPPYDHIPSHTNQNHLFKNISFQSHVT